MRQIEFRGLRTDNFEWVYGYLCPDRDGDMNIITEQPWEPIFRFKVNPSTVGQFTGLYDKNGVKVFEGDIVMVHGRGGEFWTGASIAYHSPSFKLQKDLKTCDEFGWDEWERDFEVTGNIHEPATVRE